jgi:hypothetical protein
MYQKDNRWYADWRDKRGVRRRKAFTTEEAAQQYEDDQKNLSRPKKKGGELRSRASSSPKLERGKAVVRVERGRAISTRQSRQGTSFLRRVKKSRKT